MTEYEVDLEKFTKFTEDLIQFIHGEIDGYVEQHKLDPLIGVLGPLMAASVLSLTHSMVETYIELGEALMREADHIWGNCRHIPQQAAPDLTRTESNAAAAMGRHLNHLVQQTCEKEGFGPNAALVALMRASVEQAGYAGHLAAFFVGLRRMLDGQYGVLAAEPGPLLH